MRYLTGWAESGHERLLVLWVPAVGEPVFLVPGINAAQAERNPAGLRDVRGWGDAEGWDSAFLALLTEAGEGAILIDEEMQAGHLLALQALAPERTFQSASALMTGLRQCKTAAELDALTRSGAVTDAVYAECLPLLREGITEREVKEAVAKAYERRGTRPEFAIIAFGENTALPHHASGDRALRRGDLVIMDIGCRVDDYFSDITRTVAFGEPEPEARKVYEIVYRAHQAAFAAGRPGVTGEAIDRAARDVIEAAGYGQFFIHRTGHGIGLSGHEPPNIVAGNTQPVEVGMCFSDEPGIYLPGRFGVRIENCVTVIADGLRSLNAAPPAELLVIEP